MILSLVSLNPILFISIIIADGTPMPLAGIGFISISNLSFLNVYYIPKLILNLASVGQLCDSSYSILFSSTNCYVQDPQSGRLFGIGRKHKGLYMLDELKVPDVVGYTIDLSSFYLNSSSSSFYLWHSCLTHVSSSRLKYLASTRALGKLQTNDISNYCGCKLAKFPALPFSKSVSTSYAPFDLVHFDV